LATVSMLEPRLIPVSPGDEQVPVVFGRDSSVPTEYAMASIG
jgi:hypothetical protein